MDQDRRKEDTDSLDSELESKLVIYERSESRAHSSEHGEGEEAITEINVTPLVDVALVLVIIFMAVSPFMAQASLKVLESKEGAAKGKASLEENIQLSLTKEQKLLFNEKEIEIQTLAALLRQKLPDTKDGLVTIRADESNLVGQVVEILDIAKQSGAKKVAIVNKIDK